MPLNNCLLAKQAQESTSSGMWKVPGNLPSEICHAVIQKWQAARVQPLEAFLPASKAGQDEGVRRFSKILLAKSDVTSPYQIKQNIVFRVFLLKNANLSSRVPAREILENRRM